MKKLLAALTLVTCFLIASSAMAAGAKVPKTLCLDFDTFITELQLTFKASGTIYDPATGSKVKTYAITGFVVDGSTSGPQTGTAYIAPETTILHANCNGMVGGAGQKNFFFELFYDLATGTGTIQYNIIGINAGTTTVTGIDCESLSGDVQDEINNSSGISLSSIK